VRVSENRVLRRVFGPKREEVAGGWVRLHNEELHNLYASLNIIRVIANGSFENVAEFKYLGTTHIRMRFMMKSRID
jgi:hypothetical protein